MKCSHILAVILSIHLCSPKSGVASEPSETLTLAAVEWKPLNSPELKNDGFIAEIVREALLRSGYSLTIEWAPWNRVLEISKLGLYDGILAAFYQEDREYYFEYSNPIGYEDVIFWQSKDSSYSYKTLDDFKGTSIGVLLGSSYAKDLKKHGGFEVQEATSDKHNILKLVHGRVDLFLASHVHVNYILNNEMAEYKHRVKAIKPEYSRLKMHMLISKKKADHKLIVEKFNISLSEMISDGTYEAILAKHKIQFRM